MGSLARFRAVGEDPMPDDLTLSEAERTWVLAELAGGILYEFLNGKPGQPAPSYATLDPLLKRGYTLAGKAFLLGGGEKGAA